MEDSENKYFDEMGLSKRSERENLSFMRKSNLLNNTTTQAAADDSEEDPLDAYMKEINQQAGITEPKKAPIKFSKGETLGNVGIVKSATI